MGDAELNDGAAAFDIGPPRWLLGWRLGRCSLGMVADCFLALAGGVGDPELVYDGDILANPEESQPMGAH